MARMNEVDREFEMAKSRFVREYNNEVNYLKRELESEKRKVRQLEGLLAASGINRGDDGEQV